MAGVEVFPIAMTFVMSAIVCKYAKCKRLSVRLRGAGDSDSNPAYNRSPYLEARKFRYPGLPCVDFMEKFEKERS